VVRHIPGPPLVHASAPDAAELTEPEDNYANARTPVIHAAAIAPRVIKQLGSAARAAHDLATVGHSAEAGSSSSGGAEHTQEGASSSGMAECIEHVSSEDNFKFAGVREPAALRPQAPTTVRLALLHSVCHSMLRSLVCVDAPSR
jgi:hypothetical protein